MPGSKCASWLILCGRGPPDCWSAPLVHHRGLACKWPSLPSRVKSLAVPRLSGASCLFHPSIPPRFRSAPRTRSPQQAWYLSVSCCRPLETARHSFLTICTVFQIPYFKPSRPWSNIIFDSLALGLYLYLSRTFWNPLSKVLVYSSESVTLSFPPFVTQLPTLLLPPRLSPFALETHSVIRQTPTLPASSARGNVPFTSFALIETQGANSPRVSLRRWFP